MIIEFGFVLLAAGELDSIDDAVDLLGDFFVLFRRFLLMVDGRASMMELEAFKLDLGGSLLFSFDDRTAKRD